METELMYWLLEYGKVLLAYIFLMFLWPSIMFRKYLKDKSWTYRFGFCTTAQVIIINTVILGLGLLHILNAWVVRILFYGALIFVAGRFIWNNKEKVDYVRRLMQGVYSFKQFCQECAIYLGSILKKSAIGFWSKFKKNKVEYAILILVILYGMLYFSYGAFQAHSYGFGDVYVHHSWIYGLLNGKIFSAGVYPEAMHCFVYAMHTLFGIKVFHCLLFLAGIHVMTFLVAVYCFLKEIFIWRYSSLFVLILFLALKMNCIDQVYSMSRFQWTVPQEFGFYAMFLCALYLFRYLKSDKTEGCRDENLLMFMLSLTATIIIHFYSTMIAFFLCLAIVICCLKKTFTKKYFLPLATACVLSLVIAFAPMGAALATGMEFQGSIRWGINIIKGSGTKEGRFQKTENSPLKELEQMTNVVVTDTENDTVELPNIALVPEDENIKAEKPVDSLNQIEEDIDRTVVEKKSIEPLINKVKEKINGIYKYGYATLYKERNAKSLLAFTAIAFVIPILYWCITGCVDKKKQDGKKRQQLLSNYIILALASVLYMVVYAAPLVGWPELISGSRLCTTEHVILLSVVVVPADFVLGMLAGKNEEIKNCAVILSIGCCMMIYPVLYGLGLYHSYLYYELTRYNAAVEQTNDIIKNVPKQSYTIVSVTDELYHVIQDGWHEEAITFVEKSENDEHYTLPSEYVFVYIEKKPLEYAQFHFFTGPEWLADHEYINYYQTFTSQHPNINSSNISDEAANQELIKYSNRFHGYKNLESRTIIQSKLYRWCQRFEEYHPNQIDVVYEDDAFICYKIRQNPFNLFELAI